MSSGVLNSLRRIFAEGRNPFTDAYRINRLRPPGAVDEERFMALCLRCNRCLEVCPYDSIRRAGLGPTLGTPYVFPEEKACYLCMACTRLCPTGALDTSLTNPEKTNMGRAVIDPSICYNHLFFDEDVLPEDSGRKIGALCNTCYNVCPFPDRAIRLQGQLLPVVMEGCVGCGICVERCPTRPKRAVNIFPAGMETKDEAGFYFRKARTRYEQAESGGGEPEGAMKGLEVLEQKERIDGSGPAPEFEFPYEVETEIEGWE